MENTTQILLKTPLHSKHFYHGAKMVPFAGFEMPVLYTGISEEHLAVRQSAGLFDVSHMANFKIKGPEAAAFLDSVTTGHASNLPEGKVLYSLLLNEQGKVLDDILIYRLGAEFFQLIVNASNHDKDWNWLCANLGKFKTELTDESEKLGILALQGPKAPEIMKKLGLDAALTLQNYEVGHYRYHDDAFYISRTGYTGEDGFELYAPSGLLPELFDRILEYGRDFGLLPCGLGCRDTLRLEAGMSLYGHEITEDTHPLEAGLNFAINWEKGEFIGREALEGYRKNGLQRRVVGLELIDKAIPRQDCEIYFGENAIGFVTSGTQSPYLKKGIAMAYVHLPYDKAGQEVDIMIRGQRKKARVVPRKFYQRAK